MHLEGEYIEIYRAPFYIHKQARRNDFGRGEGHWRITNYFLNNAEERKYHK